MRKAFAVLVIAIASYTTFIAACGDGNTVDADPFPTMQACFDEHHVTEGLPIGQAIVVCCLDHPLGDAMTHPSCGNTVAACVAYLGSDAVGMLSGSSAGSADVMAACQDYINKKGM